MLIFFGGFPNVKWISPSPGQYNLSCGPYKKLFILGRFQPKHLMICWKSGDIIVKQYYCSARIHYKENVIFIFNARSFTHNQE